MNIYNSTRKQNKQRGSTFVMVLAGIVVVIVVVAAGILVATHSKKDTVVVQGDGSGSKGTKASANDTGSPNPNPTSALERNRVNTQRANDASNLASAAEVYIANNNGQLPGAYSGGTLTGEAGSVPAPVSLRQYTNVEVATGAHAAVTKDHLVLVVGADCGADGKAVATSSSLGLVVLWGYENSDTGFSGKCVVG